MNRYLRLVAGLLLLFGMIYFCQYAIRCIIFPYPLDYGEAQIIDQARRISVGENIYLVDLTKAPYIIANYPPVFMTLLSPFIKWFGPNFWSGRLISSFAAFLSAFILGLICWHLSHNRLASWIVAGMFIVNPIVIYWSPLNRIDLVGLVFSLLGFYLLLKWPGKWQVWLIAAELFVLSVYVRPTFGLAAPGATLITLLGQRKYKPALIFGTVYAISGLLIFGLLNTKSKGGFYFSIITANLSKWQLSEMKTLVSAILICFLLVIILLLRPWLKAWRPIIMYLIGGLFVALTIGKVGANINYLLEIFAGLSLMVGMLVSFATHPTKSHLSLGFVNLILIVMLWMSQMVAGSFLTFRSQPEFISEMDQMRLAIRAADGPILADEFMGLLVLENRPVVFQPFDMTQLAVRAKWDQRPFLADLEAQKFSLILFSEPRPNIVTERWTPEMVAMIKAAYKIKAQVGFTTLYIPKVKE